MNKFPGFPVSMKNKKSMQSYVRQSWDRQTENTSVGMYMVTEDAIAMATQHAWSCMELHCTFRDANLHGHDIKIYRES